ncbi:hypothetical protein SAMN05920897_11289 [Alkalispirochaeta americana]|uniref:Cadherin-like beta-sandwich-like domain-containing protein n=1 Tax=Alkalispirochaeta americana TaxID=159291 RepID=A0A1N6UJN6_9SPIO|nr:cadherin-like beta sandwich domain-containing protein [Alkalispirochaeta americana]SIQ65820.1 hypothetical protein SAMN05920897_11289 [Alkalispirochaeta americana]
MKHPWYLWILAIPGVFLLASCSSPFQESSRPGENPVLTVRLPGQERISPATVMPDFSSLVEEWDLTLTHQTDLTERVATGAPGSGEPVTIDNLYPGLWDLVVKGLSSEGTVIARGEDLGISLSPGASEQRSPSVQFLQSGDPSAGGGFRLTLTVPASTGVDYLEASIEGHFSEAPSLVGIEGEKKQAILEGSDIPAGAWFLKIVFRRGGSDGTVAATLLETINLWDGVISDKWIDPDGTLRDERHLAEGFFLCPRAELEELRLAPGELDQPFSSTVTNYTFTAGVAQEVAFRSRGVSAQQRISFRWNNSDPELIHNDETRKLSFPSGDTTGTLEVTVTAADRQTTLTYTVQAVRS